MKIPCPNCNQRLDIPKELSGQTIECPACNSSIIIPDSDTLVPEPVSYTHLTLPTICSV